MRLITKWVIQFTHKLGRVHILRQREYKFDTEAEALACIDQFNRTNNPAWQGEFAAVEILVTEREDESV